MSAETRERVEQALRDHLADEAPGDMLGVWTIVLGTLTSDGQHGTFVDTTDSLPGYTQRGLLHEAIARIDEAQNE